METYLDLNGDSGVAKYQIGASSITVVFKDGKGYIYDNDATGEEHVRAMSRLAIEGRGLNTYINMYALRKYASKLK